MKTGVGGRESGVVHSLYSGSVMQASKKFKDPLRLPAPRSLLPLTLLALLSCAEPAHPPAFEMSGVIEGFYGPPWSHGDRLDMLRFMGRSGLKIYI